MQSQLPVSRRLPHMGIFLDNFMKLHSESKGVLFMGEMKKAVGGFFGGIGSYFKEFGMCVAQGDAAVKASLVVMGAGYMARKQVLKGILVTLLEIVYIAFMVMFGLPYLAKFGSLGSVKQEMVFNPKTMKNEVNDYDNSLLILLFGVTTIVITVFFLAFWVANLKSCRQVQILAERGKHLNTFLEDVRSYINDKFHITILSLPVLGIVVFTIVPLIVMVCVAFTNYDINHIPPGELFTWVGFKNFVTLFTTSTTVTFGYAFRKILVWTIVWSVLATLTTYIGGIMLAKFINNPLTKMPKMWRTLFIIAIAVPQFVTLLLVRNFFADSGIVNTICSNIGLTDLLKSVGLVGSGLNYIPFFTDPNWAKFMIIMVNIWVGVPYQMLIATGVLMNIPGELMESAKIDGANNFQIFRYITMPYMLFVTGPNLITQFTANVNNFNVIYLLTDAVFTTRNQALASSNAREVDLLVHWLYRLTSDSYNYKMAGVIAIFIFLICAVVTLVAFNYTIKGDKEENFQ